MRQSIRKIALGFATATVALSLAPPMEAAESSQTAAEAHGKAGAAAGRADFPGLTSLCTMPPAAAVTRDLVGSRPWTMPPPLAPAKVFDNLYFVGNKGVSAWVVKTSDGLILIDTLDNAEEARVFIEEGLRKLGLDPAGIRLVIITHGHGDHTGGLRYIVERYHPKIVMSAIDWAMTQDPATRIDVPGWSDFPRPDSTFENEMRLSQGGTHLRLVVTPGHTPGTLSVLLPVREGGKVHHAVLWGGTGFNFGAEAARYRTYAASAEKMRQLVLSEGIDVFLSNHVARDQADLKIAELARRQRGEPNPFVLSPRRVANAFVTLRECALAQAERIE